MDKYSVVGNPIEHSISPQIHQMFAKQTGLSISYKKILSPVDGFDKTIYDFFKSGQGLNITVPFKIEAFNIATEHTSYAKMAQAANTLKFVNNKIIAHNTDGIGLVKDIVNNLNFSLKDKEVMILGAGGATRGILLPLLEQKPKLILVANRTVIKAKQLSKEFAKYGNICGFALDKIKDKKVDVLINATSASLTSEVINLPQRLVKDALCYDLVYGKETPFMSFAKQNSAKLVVDGLGMLVEQAAQSFEFWLGVKPKTKNVIGELR